ncbi:MAG: hypothetical protein U9P00_05835, partial [Pseudomonadota bacterium]|nr:hypothetical protein [Pseudomonadota bacterium]
MKNDTLPPKDYQSIGFKIAFQRRKSHANRRARTASSSRPQGLYLKQPFSLGNTDSKRLKPGCSGANS